MPHAVFSTSYTTVFGNLAKKTFENFLYVAQHCLNQTSLVERKKINKNIKIL